MKLLFSAVTAVALAIAAPAAFAEGLSLEKDATKIEAGNYNVETSHTRLLFSNNHMGFTTWYGEFTGVTGTLTIDPAKPEASALSINFPVSSVSTSNEKLNGELKEWFEAEKYPTGTFVSTAVTPTGPGAADVTGDLTFHGVTKPVTLHVTFNAAGVNPISQNYTIGFEAQGSLKRADFGVDKYPGVLGDDVGLIISAGFEKVK